MDDRILNGIIKRILTGPSREMYEFFNSRTHEHIVRVRENLDRISTWYDFDPEDIKYRKQYHDRSKYSLLEKRAYVFRTWHAKCKNENIKWEYPEGVEKEVRKAVDLHESRNSHHPESYDSIKEMSALDLAEMVADWAAMSQELGSSLKGWAETKIGKKWLFTKAQTRFINDLIDLFPELNTKEQSNGFNVRNIHSFGVFCG